MCPDIHIKQNPIICVLPEEAWHPQLSLVPLKVFPPLPKPLVEGFFLATVAFGLLTGGFEAYKVYKA